MRHNKAINHLGRKSGHRKALLANMATSLILNKRIETTVLDLIPEEKGGDTYMVNGNMMPITQVGAAYRPKGEEEKDEEVLELEEQDNNQSGNDDSKPRKDTIPKWNNS